jgi:hypothetical protein
MSKRTCSLLALALWALLVIFLLFGGWPVMAEKLAGVTNLDQLFLSASSATPALKVNQQGAGSVAEFQDDGAAVLTIADGGSITHTGSLNVGTWGQFAVQSSVYLTMDTPITPTGTYQPITATAYVSTSQVVTGTAGQLLILTNISANNVGITDTGILKLSGDTALGQYDTLTLISDGANWIELAQTDN